VMRLGFAALALALASQIASPWPDTLSGAARSGLAADGARPPAPADMEGRRKLAEMVQRDIGRRQAERYRVDVSAQTIGGVAVRVFTPACPARADAILLNLHGGGFVVDSGSLTENIPIAGLTGLTVVAVLYRLAPEHRFPASIDDATSVYRGMLANQAQRRIGLYGTSAGAIMAAELVARLRAEGLPKPAALGFFSGSADLSRTGDTMARFLNADAGKEVAKLYAGTRDPKDPAISPARASLNGWPATLCLSSTRDYLLSATADFCRALDEAHVDARLVVFDGLPHAFWSYIEAPESDAAFATMARFLRRHLETTR
jgi:monoterpene epsilon-lactone hydrolase